MICLGFEEKLVDLMMFCVTSISYQVVINEEPMRQIIPTTETWWSAQDFFCSSFVLKL